MNYSDIIGWTDVMGYITITTGVSRSQEVQARSILAALNVSLTDNIVGPYFKEYLAWNDMGTLQSLRLRTLEQVIAWLRDDNPIRWIHLMRRLHEGVNEQRDWERCISPSGPARSQGQDRWEYYWAWLWVVAINAYAYSPDSTTAQKNAWKNYAARPGPPNRFDCVIELVFRASGVDSEHEYIGAYYRYADPKDFGDFIVTVIGEDHKA